MRYSRRIFVVFCIGMMIVAAIVILLKSVNKNTQSKTAIANPASENCIIKGGELKIEKDENGGEFGVCFFEDAKVCEEWALMRGQCPVGGIKVTGYNEAERYCVITGGTLEQESLDSLNTACLKDGKKYSLIKK